MAISTDEYAALAVDAYETYPREEWENGITVDGVQFRIIDQTSSPSGYQGTIYQRVDSGELVLAHRGTEFDRELVKDGILADGGMVLLGVNGQAEDARKFTEYAMQRAADAGEDRRASELTVTGHSLGGTLAQLTAHEYGLKGETFNAYGAAGLSHHVPEGGADVVSHVRATDFVSAASRHYGQVRIYATEQDIAALEERGYANDQRFLTDVRNPFGVAFGVGIGAHYGSNFLPSNPEGGGSIIDAQDAARYAQYQPMVDKYRNDVHLMHQGLALPRNVLHGVVDVFGHGRQAQDRFAVAAVEPVAIPLQAQASPSPDPMFQQIREQVARLDASLARTPDAASERMSASLYAKAVEAGMTRVDGVHLSIEGAQTRAGERVFAVQGEPGDPAQRRTSITTQEATQTPVEQSLAQAERARALQQNMPSPSQQAHEQRETMGAIVR